MKKKTVKYDSLRKNFILKLGGKAFSDRNENISKKKLEYVVKEVSKLTSKYNIGIVPGGGNIYRGREGIFSRLTGDHIGMVSTVINGLALKDVMESNGIKTCVLSSFRVDKVTTFYTVETAKEKMEQGYVNIFVGGTSNPFFSTDSVAAIRAAELGSSMILKATKVNGVYDRDPKKFKNARKFNKISFEKAIELKLGVIDLTAIDLCRQFKIPIVVFNFFKSGNLTKAATRKTGSIIS